MIKEVFHSCKIVFNNNEVHTQRSWRSASGKSILFICSIFHSQDWRENRCVSINHETVIVLIWPNLYCNYRRADICTLKTNIQIQNYWTWEKMFSYKMVSYIIQEKEMVHCGNIILSISTNIQSHHLWVHSDEKV